MPTLVEVLRAFPVMPILIEAKEAQVADALRQVLLDEKATERCAVAPALEAALARVRVPPSVCGASRPALPRLSSDRRAAIRCKPLPTRVSASIASAVDS